MISFAESYIFTRKLQPQMNHKGQLKRREKGFDEFFQWKNFYHLESQGIWPGTQVHWLDQFQGRSFSA